ncbi:hypothetical protein B9G98_02117 [Wickerhamiella sorbophila]|uniref:DNA replication checkpoint mediator MRC1 domain-containing protein n=1 Tax=Wickerhamiella sorbophila TaxID=45607 RepID=A0A2T0FHR0_9ASCO|nr:hypothetical protein B9G98_02117 [Wickerhamiella sorbophila]PRT54497.1 hypothetical protein B9G98_02117 [Wickerhamiella sorbophila]
MDQFEDLPLGSRLDDLLRKIDDAEDEPEDVFDYSSFIRQRRMHSDDALEESEARVEVLDPNTLEKTETLADNVSEAVEEAVEVIGGSGMENVVPEVATTPETTSEPSEPNDPVEPDSDAVSPMAQLKPSPVLDGPTDDALRREMYAEGLAPPSPERTISSQSARKPTKKALQEIAQANQRYERQMDLEIGTKTKGSATVDSFLAMLDDASDETHNTASSPPTSPITPKPNEKGHKVLLSSPPTAQRLASFVRKSIDRVMYQDASDLEVIPESTKQKTSKPLRQMLSFSRHGTTDSLLQKPAQNLMARLQDQLRKQTISKRAQKIKELQDRGIEIRTEQETAKDNEEVETLLEREQRAADELRQLEKGEADRVFDDSDVAESDIAESDIEGDDLVFSGSEDELEDNEDESGGSVRRVAVLSDSEDETEESEATSKAPTAHLAAIGRKAVTESTQVIEEPNLDVLQRIKEQAEAIAAAQSSQEVSTQSSEMGELSELDEFEQEEPHREFGNTVQPKEPDFSDLKNTNLSASQEMRELRRRYERAHVNDLITPFVEDEAQESDDEWAGLGGRSDEEPDVGDVEGLVDDTTVEVKDDQVQQLHLEKEKERDLELVNRLVDDVHGGWRRKRAGRGLLEGFSDDESDEETSAARRDAREKRKRAKLLEDSSAVAKLAANQRTRAFIETIAEDISMRPQRQAAVKPNLASVQETLQFLRADDETPDDLPEVGVKALPRATITVLSARRHSSAAQSDTTRAARISAVETGVRSVEIVKSLHAAAQPKPRRVPKLVAPQEPARKPVITASKAANRLFQRNWS